MTAGTLRTTDERYARPQKAPAVVLEVDYRTVPADEINGWGPKCKECDRKMIRGKYRRTGSNGDHEYVTAMLDPRRYPFSGMVAEFTSNGHTDYLWITADVCDKHFCEVTPEELEKFKQDCKNQTAWQQDRRAKQ
ncbi:MAG: hypothetical protein WC683_11760 [bacterium]